MESAPISASEAEDMTFFMIFELTAMGPLMSCFFFVAHEVKSTGAALSFGCNKLCHVAVNVENHVARTIERGRVRVSGTEIKEVLDCLHCFLSAGMGLSG